ncbi:hypothetical protein ABFX02_12G092200 [Erythranthe guttata]
MPSENISRVQLPPKYLQEEETLTEECRRIIATLPKEKGWLSSHLYQFQGFWYPVRHLQGVIACQKNFVETRDSDIFLVTTPKSGTTWLKAIIFALTNRTKHPVATTTDKTHPLLHNNPHDLVPFLEIKLYVDNQIPDLSTLSTPRLFSTHLPHVSLPESMKKSSACKIVYLCRNPKDIFTSLWHFTNKLRSQEKSGGPTNCIDEVFDMFCRGVSLFGPFWDHVLEYWNLSREYSDRVMFVKFEEMKEEPGVCLRRLADFLGFGFSAAEEESGVVEGILKLCSFDNLSSLEINTNGKLSSGEENKAFFRRGVVGDWKNYMSDEMVEKLDRITREKFSGSGLMM